MNGDEDVVPSRSNNIALFNNTRRQSYRLSYTISCNRKATREELQQGSVVLINESTVKVEGYLTTTSTVKLTRMVIPKGKVKFEKSEQVNSIFLYESSIPGINVFISEPVMPKAWFHDYSLRQLVMDFMKEHDAYSRYIMFKVDMMVAKMRAKAMFGTNQSGKMFYRMYYGSMGSFI